MSDDTVEIWDDLYKPVPRPPGSFDPPEKRYLTGIDTLVFGRNVHLVLGRNAKDLRDAVHRLRLVLRYAGYTCELLTDDVPCLVYHVDSHWTVIHNDMSELQKSGKQAFIATMNTFAIDQFYFKSKHDAHARILYAGAGGSIRRIAKEDADDFFTAYKVGVQFTSEVLRTKGLW